MIFKNKNKYCFLLLVFFILVVLSETVFSASQEKTVSENAVYLTEMAAKRTEEALAAYDGANYPNKPLWKEAIDYGEKAIKADENYVEGHYALALIYEYTNWYFKEAREWEKYIELIKKNKVISPQVEEKLAYAYYRLGYSAYQRGDYGTCIAYLKEAISVDAEMIEAHYWLGRVFYEIDNLTDSQMSWEKVLDIDARYPKAEYFLNKVEKSIKYGKEAYESYEAGYKLYEQKLYENAIYQYRQAIRYNNDFSSAYYWLGRIYFELGNYKESVNNWKEVLRLDPENKDAIYWLKQAEKLSN